ncbi:hypothetical protein SAMN05216315_10167 [Nitrosospira sp. Nsp18]|uniref:hypothetical protein n=1 Tax=Nitrosospira sp. Nsp18 TaxID=1855334 RepID=UPI000887053A|nr:hypothetical protein [Nitrosospira sp. Nsp18]SDA09621.1 hypothetical protein SAMN05216315_10167 [Nitrosospira sp. Nsp18]
MSKPNKRRRELNRINRNRADLTEIRATEKDERRPLKNFESNYEITRGGEIFSKRLKRFIKHRVSPHSEYSTYIRFELAGETKTLGVGKAIAETWLSDTDINNIIRSIPEEINSIETARQAGLIQVIGKNYDVSARAIFYVLKTFFGAPDTYDDRIASTVI